MKKPIIRRKFEVHGIIEHDKKYWDRIEKKWVDDILKGSYYLFNEINTTREINGVSYKVTAMIEECIWINNKKATYVGYRHSNEFEFKFEGGPMYIYNEKGEEVPLEK